MNTVEAGVSNFRDFQVEARAFFTSATTRAESEQDFHNKRDQEIKEALEEANRQSARRQNWIMVGIAILSLLVAVLLLLHTVEDGKKGLLKIPPIFQKNTGEVYSARGTTQEVLNEPHAQ